MILTYHEAIELMSYLPMALPAASRAINLNDEEVDQSELGHLHQSLPDLESLALNTAFEYPAFGDEPLRQTA